MLTILIILRAALTNSTTPSNNEGADNITIRNDDIYGLEAKSATKILNNKATNKDIILMAIADSDNNEFVDMIISSLEMEKIIPLKTPSPN